MDDWNNKTFSQLQREHDEMMEMKNKSLSERIELAFGAFGYIITRVAAFIISLVVFGFIVTSIVKLF